MTKKSRQRIFWALVALFLLVAPPIILYTNGWRLTPDLKIKRTGGLFINTRLPGVEIYIDGELKKRTNLLYGAAFFQGLTPKKISVIAAKENYWPWTKELEIEESVVTEAHPLLIPTSLEGKMVLRGSYINLYYLPNTGIIMLEKEKGGLLTYEFYLYDLDEFLTPIQGKTLLSPPKRFKTFLMQQDTLKLIFEEYSVDVSFNRSSNTLTALKAAPHALTSPTLPHKTYLDIRSRGMIYITENNKEIWGEWISSDPLPYYFSEKKIKIFEAKTTVSSLDFYPKRRDVAIFASVNGIFAIELDGRGTRNFQPIYKGKNPTFTVVGNILYILDDGILIKATLP